MPFGVVLYYWQWSVEISWTMGLLEEWDGAVVGVFRPLPSGPLSAHFRPHPCNGRDRMRVVGYLLNVVYKVICAPPPM